MTGMALQEAHAQLVDEKEATLLAQSMERLAAAEAQKAHGLVEKAAREREAAMRPPDPLSTAELKEELVAATSAKEAALAFARAKAARETASATGPATTSTK